MQQPQIQYLRNLDQPGVNILLAVISLTTEGSINSLTYKSGRNERRYVGTSVGSVNFVTEGAGVNQVVSTPSNMGGATLRTDYASISARREGSRADLPANLERLVCARVGRVQPVSAIFSEEEEMRG